MRGLVRGYTFALEVSRGEIGRYCRTLISGVTFFIVSSRGNSCLTSARRLCGFRVLGGSEIHRQREGTGDETGTTTRGAGGRRSVSSKSIATSMGRSTPDRPVNSLSGGRTSPFS